MNTDDYTDHTDQTLSNSHPLSICVHLFHLLGQPVYTNPCHIIRLDEQGVIGLSDVLVSRRPASKWPSFFLWNATQYGGNSALAPLPWFLFVSSFHGYMEMVQQQPAQSQSSQTPWQASIYQWMSLYICRWTRPALGRCLANICMLSRARIVCSAVAGRWFIWLSHRLGLPAICEIA